MKLQIEKGTTKCREIIETALTGDLTTLQAQLDMPKEIKTTSIEIIQKMVS